MMTKADFYLHDLASKFRKIEPLKYYLSYSGGKDSHLLFWFLKTWLPLNYLDMADYKTIPIVSVNTRMEWPEIANRMIKNSDVILIPKLKPQEVIAKYGTPCFSKQSDVAIRRYQSGLRSHAVMSYIEKVNPNGGQPSMFGLSKNAHDMLLDGSLPKISAQCCKIMKKNPMYEYQKLNGRNAILGIVAVESLSRAGRYKTCFTKDGQFSPIWDLTEDVEEEIYQQYHIEVPAIYNYVNQTGCAGCPYGIGLGHTEKELALMTPAKRRYVSELFKDAYRVRGVDIHKPLQTTLADYIPQYDTPKEPSDATADEHI